MGYNHGSECRPIAMDDLNKVKSKKASPYVLEHAKLCLYYTGLVCYGLIRFAVCIRSACHTNVLEL